MIFKRESKRMLKKQIAKLEKLGWKLEEDLDVIVSFTKKNGDGIHELDICHKLDVDTYEEKPAEIYSYQISNTENRDVFNPAVSLTAPEAWAAIGIAVAKGWRAMK